MKSQSLLLNRQILKQEYFRCLLYLSSSFENVGNCGPFEITRRESSSKTNPFSFDKGDAELFIKGRNSVSKSKVIINSVLHKTYLSIKERHKIQKSHKNLSTSSHKIPSLHFVNFHHEKLDSPVAKSMFSDMTVHSICEDKEKSMKLTLTGAVNKTFWKKVFDKYQQPSQYLVDTYLQMFPEPKKLYDNVLKPVREAGILCELPAHVSCHLGGRYWKVRLRLLWPRRITVTGIHFLKDEAVTRAYLLMCHELLFQGLVTLKEGMGKPTHSDDVLEILELLSDYGNSAIGSSKGRGFKIVLEQVAGHIGDLEDGDNTKASTLGSSSGLDSPKSSIFEKDVLNGVSEVLNDGNGKLSYSEINANEKRHFSACSSENTLSFQFSDDIDLTEVSGHYKQNSYIIGRGQESQTKPIWKYSVHVGWPIPFSMQLTAPSLPSAQKLGLLATINKLRNLDLLSKCNQTVSHSRLKNAVVLETTRMWYDFNTLLPDESKLQEFNPDAKIFVDASRTGFGAYLLLSDTNKVSWLSERWDDHEQINTVITSSNSSNDHNIKNKSEVASTLSELFALVITIFSWKQKLKHRRLLCFNDNRAIISLVTSLNFTPVSNECCLNIYDFLIHTLQQTCQHYNIQIQTAWLGRHQNQLADWLSRNKIQEFRKAIPMANRHKTRAKRFQFRDDLSIR